MSSPVTSPLTSAPTPASASSAATAASATSTPAVSENMFLQLLVAQLKYQDPDSPADGTQFVTELATFSEVDNSTTMVSDLNSIQSILSSPAAMPAATTTTPGTSATPATGVTPLTSTTPLTSATPPASTQS